MTNVGTIRVIWREDGSATCLARVTARDATGAATGINGEGKWLKQADLTSITCAVFDRSDTVAPDTPIATPSVSIPTAIQDMPVTNQQIWDLDATGYNFLHDLGPANFPIGGHTYRVEYKFTTTGGTVGWVVFEGVADPVWTS